jgi:hypothetical protein
MFRLNRNKQKKPPKQFEREYIWVLFRKIWVVPVCFDLFRTRLEASPVAGCPSRRPKDKCEAILCIKILILFN